MPLSGFIAMHSKRRIGYFNFTSESLKVNTTQHAVLECGQLARLFFFLLLNNGHQVRGVDRRVALQLKLLFLWG